jgi:hypothetical protein
MKSAATFLLLVFCFSLPAQAQDHVRDGFWIGAGLGVGSVGFDCSFCNDERESGVSGNIRLGGTLNQRVQLGAMLAGWDKSQANLDGQVGGVHGVVVFYPSETGGFWLQAGLGAMSFELDDGIDVLKSSSFSFTAGLGYDIRVGRNVSLAPYFHAMGSGGGGTEINGIDFDFDLNPNLAQIGLAVTIH